MMSDFDNKRKLSQVAVLGSGTMGRQIPAHCANAEIETLLFGVEKKADHPDSAAFAMEQLKSIKPPALADAEHRFWLHACNYDDDLPRLHDCDWVIEAVSENPDVKRSLYQRIAPHLKPDCILSHPNTCLLYTSPSPRDRQKSRMPSSA